MLEAATLYRIKKGYLQTVVSKCIWVNISWAFRTSLASPKDIVTLWIHLLDFRTR